MENWGRTTFLLIPTGTKETKESGESQGDRRESRDRIWKPATKRGFPDIRGTFLPCDCMSYNARYCEGISVHPSICLPVKRVHCDKTKEACVHILTPYEKTAYHSFLTRRNVDDRRPLLPEILGQTDPVETKTPIFNRYSLVAPQP